MEKWDVQAGIYIDRMTASTAKRYHVQRDGSISDGIFSFVAALLSYCHSWTIGLDNYQTSIDLTKKSGVPVWGLRELIAKQLGPKLLRWNGLFDSNHWSDLVYRRHFGKLEILRLHNLPINTA